MENETAGKLKIGSKYTVTIFGLRNTNENFKAMIFSSLGASSLKNFYENAYIKPLS